MAGLAVLGFDESIWQQQREAIIITAPAAKFSQHPELAEFLWQTGGHILVEASPVDQIWGIGLNLLGFV